MPLHILFAGYINTQVSSDLLTLTNRLKQFGLESVFELEQNDLVSMSKQFSGLPMDLLIGGPIIGDLDIQSVAAVLNEWLVENIGIYRIMLRQGGQIDAINDLSTASLAQIIGTSENAQDAQIIIEKI
jgi:hypothetical protein